MTAVPSKNHSRPVCEVSLKREPATDVRSYCANKVRTPRRNRADREQVSQFRWGEAAIFILPDQAPKDVRNNGLLRLSGATGLRITDSHMLMAAASLRHFV